MSQPPYPTYYPLQQRAPNAYPDPRLYSNPHQSPAVPPPQQYTRQPAYPQQYPYPRQPGPVYPHQQHHPSQQPRVLQQPYYPPQTLYQHQRPPPPPSPQPPPPPLIFSNPNVTRNPPVSRSASQSPSRPLPTPHGRGRPESMPPPAIRSGMPVHPTAPQPTQLIQTPANSNTSRPLPTPTPTALPRSTKHFSLDLGSGSGSMINPITNTNRPPSPEKRRAINIPTVFAQNPVPQSKPDLPPAQPLINGPGPPKFVPLWKRNSVPILPSFSLDKGKAKEVETERSMSPTKRPLPPSPTPAPDLSGVARGRMGVIPQRAVQLDSEVDSDSDTDLQGVGEREARTPSPQYGIRDLPLSRASAVGQKPVKRAGTGPRAPAGNGSMTLKFAAMGVDGRDSSASQPRARLNNDTWPTDVPRLPRTPGTASQPFSPDANHQLPSFSPNPATRQQPPFSRQRVPDVINLDDAPPPSLRRTPSPSPALPQPPRWNAPLHTQNRPGYVAKIESPAPVGGRETRADIPRISFPDADDDGSEESEREGFGMRINVAGPEAGGMPQISVSAPRIDVAPPQPQIAVSGASGDHAQRGLPPPPPVRRGGLVCGGCGGAIIGRIVSAMGARWHPGCFKCTVCDGLLEHVSSYEWEGRPYCHLDYHENFAPRCYHCRTAIIDERFITLDDPALGKRTYHEQHFFCAECGDPFLAPSSVPRKVGGEAGAVVENLRISGDGDFEEDDVGFTVYRGHPYCEACHVRLRMPKCKRCKRSIRDGKRAVEALGGKWCWECFVCAGCENPFEDPSFFERGNEPFCQSCFSIILRNEV